MEFRKLKGHTNQISLLSFICTTLNFIASNWHVLNTTISPSAYSGNGIRSKRDFLNKAHNHFLDNTSIYIIDQFQLIFTWNMRKRERERCSRYWKNSSSSTRFNQILVVLVYYFTSLQAVYRFVSYIILIEDINP